MIRIKSISVKPNFSSFYLIQWTIEDTLEDISNYTFSVHKALAPNGPYGLVAEGITDTEYTYQLPNPFNSSIHEYFKIGVAEVPATPEEPEEPQSPPITLSDISSAAFVVPPDAFAEAIIYQETYLLEEILGRPPVKLLIKRRTGTRCTNCWDDELQDITNSQCNVCYSTGYVGGYSVHETYISFTEPGFQTKFDIGDIKDVQNMPTIAWGKNYPLILPGDIIVDEFNRRFRVLQSQPTTKDGRIYLRQNIQLQLIPPTDIVYQIQV